MIRDYKLKILKMPAAQNDNSSHQTDDEEDDESNPLVSHQAPHDACNDPHRMDFYD